MERSTGERGPKLFTLVQPWALANYSAARIREKTGISLSQVYSSKTYLRRKHILAASIVEENRCLALQLANPPEDFCGKQRLLDSVKFSFYRRHKHLFASAREILQDAGFSFNAASLLNFEVLSGSIGVPFKDFRVRRREKGEIVVVHYRIILAADRQQTVLALKAKSISSINPS